MKSPAMITVIAVLAAVGSAQTVVMSGSIPDTAVVGASGNSSSVQIGGIRLGSPTLAGTAAPGNATARKPRPAGSVSPDSHDKPPGSAAVPLLTHKVVREEVFDESVSLILAMNQMAVHGVVCGVALSDLQSGYDRSGQIGGVTIARLSPNNAVQSGAGPTVVVQLGSRMQGITISQSPFSVAGRDGFRNDNLTRDNGACPGQAPVVPGGVDSSGGIEPAPHSQQQNPQLIEDPKKKDKDKQK
jgi:hypothetical protein